MFNAVNAFVDRLVGLSALFGALGLVTVTGVVIVDVVGRYFNQPLYGAQDVVQMAAVFIVFGGMAYCERRGGHIAVDLLEHRFSPELNRWLTVAGATLGAVIFALIAWQVWEASKLARMLNMSTNILYLPRAPFQYALAAMSAVTSLALAMKALNGILGRARPGHYEPKA